MLFAGQLFAQKANFRGFIYEKKSGEPIPFANVKFEGTSIGASSNYDGFFLVQDVEPGDYVAQVTFVGYDTVQMPIKLKAGEILSKKFYLDNISVELQTVNITAERQAAKTETRTSVVKVTPKQISVLPSIGGQADLAQYVQVIPGVVFTGDQGGQLYIRGGSPIMNKVLLDGMVIYNPFHSIGLFSVFNNDIMRSTDVYTGGFGAEYGGRISSVMDIKTRPGSTKEYKGKVGASTFGANLTLEGPLKPILGIPKSSFIISAKNSYLSATSKELYSYVNKDGLPFDFLDIYGKLTLGSKSGSALNVFGFRFEDNVKAYKGLSDYNWKSNGLGANFIMLPISSTSIIDGNVSYSDYRIESTLPEGGMNYSDISGFSVAMNISSFGKNVENKTGLEVNGYKTDMGLTNKFNQLVNQVDNTTEFGAYTSFKLKYGKFLIEPGARVQWYSSLGNVSFEPRLAAKYLVNDRFRLKLASGTYSQNFISTTNERDIVNLFYGFISGPENLPKKFDGEAVKHKLQKSEHIIVGAEYDLTQLISLNVEAYYKNFSQLTGINGEKLYSKSNYPDGVNPILYEDFSVEDGYAKGVDVTLKYEDKRLYLWGAYSLGFVKRRRTLEDGTIQTYSPHFDRRHNVNLLAVLKLGAKSQWEISARWNFGSPFPFTQVVGGYENIIFNGPTSDYTSQNGNVGLIYSDDYNAGRLIDYHRLDLSVKKIFYFTETTKLDVNFSLTNVYDRENLFYIDAYQAEKVYQLPILPSIGLNFSF